MLSLAAYATTTVSFCLEALVRSVLAHRRFDCVPSSTAGIGSQVLQHSVNVEMTERFQPIFGSSIGVTELRRNGVDPSTTGNNPSPSRRGCRTDHAQSSGIRPRGPYSLTVEHPSSRHMKP